MAWAKNITDGVVRFRIAGLPAEPVQRFEVKPGESVEVPDDIAHGGLLAKIAKGLQVLPGKPRAETPMPFVVPDPNEANTAEIKPRPAKKRKG